MKSNPACQVAFGVAPEFLEALDKRALAADGFTAATGDSVENHWLFAGRFAGRRDPGDNGLVALAVPDAADQPGHVNDGQPRRLGKMVDRHVIPISQQKPTVL